MNEPTSDMQDVLNAYMEMGPLPTESLTPGQARNLPTLDKAVLSVAGKRVSNRLLKGAMPLINKVEHIKIPSGADGILARVYTPSGSGPFPVVVYFHGGGFVIANLDAYDSSCRAIANGAECVVVSVAYRLAPEHAFPAAHEDAYTAFQYVAAHAGAINGDPRRVAVAGESAGGCLAAAVCLMARDRGGKMPTHQLLVYPVTSWRFDSPSYQENATAKPLNAATMAWFKKYTFKQPTDAANPYASPLEADLAGMPPATVINAELDPLRDDGLQYAEKLRAAGVPVVSQKVYDGTTHEFFGMAVVVGAAKDANEQATDDLKQSFSMRAAA